MNTLREAVYNRILTRTILFIVVVVLVLAISIPGLASDGEVTRGRFHAFATGVRTRL